jgi:Ca2+-binding RTX toxin-like protein
LLSGVTLAGSNTLQVRVEDAAGNAGTAKTQAYVLDTTAPNAPIITNLTYTATWSLSGTAEANSSVAIYEGATKLGSTTAAGGGTWAFAAAENNSAIRIYAAIATDIAGNVSASSKTYYEGSSGNDTFNFANQAALVAAGGIYGNAGTNKIALTAATTLNDADFVNIKTIQQLSLTGASTVTLAANALSAGINSVITGSGATSITGSNAGTLAVNATAMTSGSILTLNGSVATTVTDTATGSLNIAAGALTGALTLSGAEDFSVRGLKSNLTATTVTGALNVTTGAVTALTIATAGGSVSTNNIDASAMTSGQSLALTGSKAATVKVGGNLSASAYTGNLTVTGNSAANTLNGGAGADTLIGGAGNDTLIGGAGNDTAFYAGTDPSAFFVAYSAQNKTFTVTDNTSGYNEGIDLLSEIEKISFGNIYVANLIGGTTASETLTGLSGKNAIYADAGNDILNGGSDADLLFGGIGNDTLNGNAGDDALNGDEGTDTLSGGADNDWISGGAGADTLTGGAGADKFRFNQVSDSVYGLADLITDYSKLQGDTIDLSAIDAKTGGTANDSFSWLSGALTTNNANGALWMSGNFLYGSTNADVQAEFAVQITGVTSQTNLTVVL